MQEKNEDRKNKEYRKIQEIRTHEKRQRNCYVLVGDFNARILRGDGLYQENFGRHFLKSEREIHEINKDVWDNREIYRLCTRERSGSNEHNVQ